ncbi:MAG: hypothetical protein AAFX93_13710 [Verrucomicrobiota bacterium]
MKPLALFLFVALAGLFGGCESTTTSVDDGFGMEFKNDPDADEAKVID